jgi:hypothetical protein
MKGDLGTLRIYSVDHQGKVSGFLMVHKEMAAYPVKGYWNERTRKLTFHTCGPIPASAVMGFSGYLFKDKFRIPGVMGSVTHTIAGSYVAFADVGGSAQQHEFGWYGQIGLR